MEAIQLSIPNMKSPHCMMVVTNTLKIIPGASLKRIASGEAEVELTGATKSDVVQAIEKAGYRVANK